MAEIEKSVYEAARLPSQAPVLPIRRSTGTEGASRADPGEFHVVAADVVKHYPDCEALRGVSLTMSAGEVLGLLGPNGAGKSTFVEILEGVRPRTSGRVEVLGMDPEVHPAAVKGRIGVCLQSTMLPARMRVVEILELFACMYSRPPIPTQALLERFHLEEKRAAFYSDLSGGQRQRLALALAVQNDPDLLILDEPTAGLDAQARVDIQDLILELRRQGKSILLTTHYIEEADRLCDRIAVIDRGIIVAEGTPEELRGRAIVPSRISLRLSADLPEWLLVQLKKAHPEVEYSDSGLRIATADPGSCILEISRWLLASGHRIDRIEVTNASLEDAFIGLTGREVRG